MSNCASCGSPMGEADRFCEACGAHVAGSEAIAGGEATADTDVTAATAATADTDVTAATAATAGNDVTAETPFRLIPPAPLAAPPAAPATPTGPPCAGCGAGAEQRDAEGYCQNCGLLGARPRDHQEFTPDPSAGPTLADIGAVSDRGIRHHRNEDAVDLRVALVPQASIVAVIADGVSSSVNPDTASALAVQVAGDEIATGLAALEPDPAPELVAALISTAVRQARSAVADLGGPDARAASSPACTIVLAVAVAGDVHLSWLGDSRAYWIPVAGPAVVLTVDDSGAAEAIEAGIAPEVAYRLPQAHAITAWLGVDAPPIAPHLGRLPSHLLAAGGILVVCSDGLWNYLTDAVDFAEQVRLQAAISLAAADGSALDLARRLVTFAITAGGSDNITVAILPAAAIASTVTEGVRA